jgi:hypothetical protein
VCMLGVQEAAASAKAEEKDSKRRRTTDEPKAAVGEGTKRKERDSIMPQPSKASSKVCAESDL